MSNTMIVLEKRLLKVMYTTTSMEPILRSNQLAIQVTVSHTVRASYCLLCYCGNYARWLLVVLDSY